MPSELLLGFVKDIWADIAGKIFLLSVVYYLLSSLTFSGYLSQFTNGFSGLAFNDFTFGDLLFFFPTIVIATFHIIKNSFLETIKGFFVHIVLPLAIGLGLSFLNSIVFPFYDSVESIGWSLRLSFFIWYIGLLLTIWVMPDKHKKTLSVTSFFLQFFGSFFFFATMQYLILYQIQLPQPQPVSVSTNIVFDSFWIIIIVIVLFISPIALGKKIAVSVIDEKLLSKISQLQLTIPINNFENLQIVRVTSDKKKKAFWKRFEPVYDTFAPNVYRYSLEKDVFLIGSFNKVTALYIMGNVEKELENSLLFLSNNVIHSCTIQSDYRENQKHT